MSRSLNHDQSVSDYSILSRQWPLIHGCLIMNALLPALVLVLPSAGLAGHGAAHIKKSLGLEARLLAAWSQRPTGGDTAPPNRLRFSYRISSADLDVARSASGALSRRRRRISAAPMNTGMIK
jgi:hypothetical protein